MTIQKGQKLRLGSRHTVESKQKISRALFLRVYKDQTRKKHSLSMKGNQRGFKKGQSSWNSGTSKGIITSHGYKMIKPPSDYPFLKKRNGYVMEHRYVMEMKLGRALSSDEVVHHVNWDKVDNRIENLELMSASAHNRLPKIPENCPHCGKVIKKRI